MDPDPAAGLAVTFVFILFALILVFLNGFFVAAEFAIVKVRRTRLQELAAKGHHRAKVALGCVNQLDEYLSVCQLGITLVSLGLGWIGEQSFYNLFIILWPNPPFAVEVYHLIATGISFFIISMLHVVLGELVPKSMAIQRAEKISLMIAQPLRVFYLVSKPLIDAFTWMANVCLKAIGYYGVKESPMTEEELKMVIGASAKEGVISANEAQIIHRAFSFSDKTLKDIMIPLPKVQYLSLARSFEENKAVVLSRNHTRFPLCRNNMNDVIGVVHMKDIRFQHEESNSLFERVLRPALYIPSSEPEDRVMKLFSEKRFHLAIVQDAKTKKNIGIVTMEDILEELVGEIIDEHGN